MAGASRAFVHVLYYSERIALCVAWILELAHRLGDLFWFSRSKSTKPYNWIDHRVPGMSPPGDNCLDPEGLMKRVQDHSRMASFEI